MVAYSFHGRIDKLEIARGYDGLLGGTPSPVILFAIYASDGSGASLLGRSIHHFRPHRPFPSDVATPETRLPTCVVETGGSCRFVALALALEEDSGLDVQRMYGALERHHDLSAWAPREEVDPLSLAAASLRWPAPISVQLCVGGVDAGAACRGDKWVGAVCWGMSPEPGLPPQSHRLPFLSSDGRNDWTALISVAHG